VASVSSVAIKKVSLCGLCELCGYKKSKSLWLIFFRKINMENNDDILNRAVDALKKRPTSELPEDILKQTAFRLKAAQTRGHWWLIFKPSLAAAMVLIAASALIYFFVTNFNSGSVAWADVQHCIGRITFAHCYNTRSSDTEAWYIDGVLYLMEKGEISKDDGKTKYVYDSAGRQVSFSPSDFGGMLGQNTSPFVLLTQGVFEYDSNDVNSKVPVYIGEDLLVYKFDAPKSMKSWAKGVVITAGRQSKLPVYMKIIPWDSNRQADIFIFDYEKQELPEVITKICDCQ
jgi:hypothetical protein